MISCTSLVLAAEPPVFAREQTNVFTLKDVIATALGKNPELRVVEAAIASAKGGVVTARAIPNPATHSPAHSPA